MPFKSDPELAAVAVVLGTLSVEVSEICIQDAGILKALLATCYIKQIVVIIIQSCSHPTLYMISNCT